MSETPGPNEAPVVERDGLRVEKTFKPDEFSVPTIEFTITSERDEPVRFRLADLIPEEFPMDGVGFHPDYGSEQWSYADGRVEYEHTLDVGEQLVTIYGIRLSGDDDATAFLTAPKLVDVRPVTGSSTTAEGPGEPAVDDVVPESSTGVVRDVITGERETVPGLEDDSSTGVASQPDSASTGIEAVQSDDEVDAEAPPATTDPLAVEDAEFERMLEEDESGIDDDLDDGLDDLEDAAVDELLASLDDEGDLDELDAGLDELDAGDEEADGWEDDDDVLDFGYEADAPPDTSTDVADWTIEDEAVEAEAAEAEAVEAEAAEAEAVDDEVVADEVIEEDLEEDEAVESTVQSVDEAVVPVIEPASDTGEEAVSADASGSESDVTSSSLDESVAAALAAELRSGSVEDDDLDVLTAELGLALSESTDARMQYVQSRMGDLDAYVEALEAFIDENGTAGQFVEETSDELDRIRSDLSSLEDLVAANTDDVTAVRDTVVPLQDRIGDLSDTVEGVAGSVGDMTERVEDVEGLVEGTDGRFANVEESVSDVSTDVDRLESDVESIREESLAVAETVERLEASVSTVQSAIDALEGDVSDDVRSIEAEFETIKEDVDRLQRWRDQLGEMFSG